MTTPELGTVTARRQRGKENDHGVGGERLLAWYGAGDTDYRLPGTDMVFRVSAETAEFLRETRETTGALVLVEGPSTSPMGGVATTPWMSRSLLPAARPHQRGSPNRPGAGPAGGRRQLVRPPRHRANRPGAHEGDRGRWGDAPDLPRRQVTSARSRRHLRSTLPRVIAGPEGRQRPPSLSACSLCHDSDEGGDGDGEGLKGQRATTPGG